MHAPAKLPWGWKPLNDTREGDSIWRVATLAALSLAATRKVEVLRSMMKRSMTKNLVLLLVALGGFGVCLSQPLMAQDSAKKNDSAKSQAEQAEPHEFVIANFHTESG